MAQREPPEVASFPCVDAVETAADKLSALAWRVLVRDRTSPNDDPTIIRHLHDFLSRGDAAGGHRDFDGGDSKSVVRFKDQIRNLTQRRSPRRIPPSFTDEGPQPTLYPPVQPDIRPHASSQSSASCG